MSIQFDNAPNVQNYKKSLIDITARIISRTAGGLARAIGSTFKTKKEYPQPVPKSSILGQAVNPANQGIIDALIEKAESYPANKGYQRNAYITVAEMVAINKKSIGLRTYRWRPGLFNIEGIEFNVGKSTGKFIIAYLKDKPERVRIVERFPIPGQAANPANKGLVDALIEKAESYPDNKVYQRNAYISVAEMVAINKKSIGLRTYMWRPGLCSIEGIEFNTGKSTGQFIIAYLKDKPEKVRSF